MVCTPTWAAPAHKNKLLKLKPNQIGFNSTGCNASAPIATCHCMGIVVKGGDSAFLTWPKVFLIFYMHSNWLSLSRSQVVLFLTIRKFSHDLAILLSPCTNLRLIALRQRISAQTNFVYTRSCLRPSPDSVLKLLCLESLNLLQHKNKHWRIDQLFGGKNTI